MNPNRNHRVLFRLVWIGLVCGWASAASWRLSDSGQWTDVAQDPKSKKMLAISAFKDQIAAGKTDEARKSLEGLQKEFPELAGPEMAAFLAAEEQYAKRDWVKAVRQYDEFLDKYPTSWLTESALEREYSVAVAYLNGEKRRVLLILRLSAVEDGAKVMQKIADRTGDAPIARRSLVTLARSYEKQKMYMEAYETWVDVSSRWPTGETGQQALLEMGQDLHSSYKGPAYDHKGLASAKSYYANYALRYPDDAKTRDMDGKQKLIDEQIAYKQFLIGRYYDRTDDDAAAETYYNQVLENWPDSNGAQRAQARLDERVDGQLPPEPRKLNRKVVDGVGSVLDHWFGVTWIFKPKTTPESAGAK
jgi:outer membrane protein assembly factor BamD (BamD/ComL family)